MLTYLLGAALGGLFLWRLLGWLAIARSAYRVWRYLRQQPSAEGDQQQNADRPIPDAVLSRKEALRVLELDDGADRDQIMARYRQLMQKNHPDRGGSSYLATLINAAKNKLLE